MEAEVAKRLFDGLQAARRIRGFTDRLDFGQFEKSELVRSAVERQFEIIGEALGKAAGMDPSLMGKMPDLPRIVGLRNRLIHGYDSVDDELIWDIVQTRILPLIERLETLLGEFGFPTEAGEL
jgi:uncharacterized protein with HEPN domain